MKEQLSMEEAMPSVYKKLETNFIKIRKTLQRYARC